MSELLGAAGKAALAWGSRVAALRLNFSWSRSQAFCAASSPPDDFSANACEADKWEPDPVARGTSLFFSALAPSEELRTVTARFGVEGEKLV